jgi:hypothetical protein
MDQKNKYRGTDLEGYKGSSNKFVGKFVLKGLRHSEFKYISKKEVTRRGH